MQRPLEGIRVLLVEDEYLVAMMAEDMLHDLGAQVFGPADSAEKALQHVEYEEFDCAILDVNLRGGTSEPVAKTLASRGIPYAFATGYGSPQKDAVVISKPYTERMLLEAIRTIMTRNDD